MRNIFAIAAVLAAGLLVFDSIYKFFARNTKKYIMKNSFTV